jgi:hypothetical protein
VVVPSAASLLLVAGVGSGGWQRSATSSLTIADRSRIRDRKLGISPQNDPDADLSLFRMIALNQGRLPRGVWR